MSQPSDAAKAASILHHTWGVDSYSKALEIYNTLAADEDTRVAPLLERMGVGPWDCVALLSDDEWWENVESLALSIDAAREWEFIQGESK